jgi:hypothetical protein
MDTIITNISAIGTLVGAITALAISTVNLKQLKQNGEIQSVNNLLSVYYIDKELREKARELIEANDNSDIYNNVRIKEAAEKYLNSFETFATNIILNKFSDKHFRAYLEPQVREMVNIFNRHKSLREILSNYQYTVKLYERWRFNILPYEEESGKLTRKLSESPFFFL